jgi:hypothetical protein
MLLLLFSSALAAPATLGDRVAAALLAGDCASARALAEKQAEVLPHDPVAAKLLGDAHRCASDAYLAIRSYEHARELGSADPNLQRLIDSQQKAVGHLAVTLSGADLAVGAPVLRVLQGTAVLPGAAPAYPTYTWPALPLGVALQLEVGGPGIAPRVEPLGPFTADEARALALPVVQQALAVLVVPAWTARDVRVELVQGAVRTPLAPGDNGVPAGPGVVAITGPYGELGLPVTLVSGARAPVAVDENVPGLLSLVGLPAGATVTLSGPAAPPAPLVVPAAVGTLDRASGVRVAPAQPLTGLHGGAYGVQVTHPVLGAVDLQVDVIGGEITTRAVDPATFPRSADLRAAYITFEQARRREARVPAFTAVAAGGAVLGLGGVALGAILYEGAVSRLADERAAYALAGEDGDVAAMRTAYEGIATERRAAVLPLVALAGGGALTVGFGATGVLSFAKHRHDHPVPVWDPALAVLPAPVVPPAAAPPVAPVAPPPAAPPAPALP